MAYFLNVLRGITFPFFKASCAQIKHEGLRFQTTPFVRVVEALNLILS